MRVRHTVVISDVHLAEAEPREDEWLRWRQRRFFPDVEFAALAEALFARLGDDDRLDFVFDGDVFEFEAPKIIDGESFYDDPPRTEVDAVDRLARVINDHTLFFSTIAKIAGRGHRVVFVAGNHDAQLTFPAVEHELRQAIFRALPEGVDRARADVVVQPWFYQTDDGIHVEHGHQYDAYCSFRDPLRPLDANGREIQPTVGSLAFRHLVARMGYFNAYDERSFMLSLPRYLAHWVRYYLFTRRSLALTWFRGALRIVAEVVKSRPGRVLIAAIREQAAITRAAYAKTLALDAKALAAHSDLFAEPADADPHRVVREMRLDHAALAVVGVAGLITAAFKPKLGLLIALSAMVVGVAQELIAPKQPINGEYRTVDGVARSLAKIYDARAVVFGHTHIPHAKIENGIVYANAGSWAPIMAPEKEDEIEARTASTRGRPVVWLRTREDELDAPVEGGLYRFKDGALYPQVVTVSADDVEEVLAPLEPSVAAASRGR